MQEIDKKILIEGRLYALVDYINKTEDEFIREEYMTKINDYLDELEILYDYNLKEFKIDKKFIAQKKNWGYYFVNSTTNTIWSKTQEDEKLYDKMKIMENLNALFFTLEKLKSRKNKNK